jgi:hypothetical protein
LNVLADTPAFDQGETAENPIPLPNASNTKVSAAAATPPAIIAAQEVADWPDSTTLAVSLPIVSIMAPLWLKIVFPTLAVGKSSVPNRKIPNSKQEDPNRKKRAAGADDRCPNVVSLRIVHISRAWAEEADERIPKDGSFGSKRAMCSAE